MMHPKYLPFVLKHVTRHRTRSILTAAGVAVAMFLFCAVQSMQTGVQAATQVTAQDTTLVVYRENRYCPFSSRLPQFYEQRIRKLDGVTSVVPMRIVVSNCRASLDVVTFRGVPREQMESEMARDFEVLEGSIADWARRSDAAIVGESLAARRRIRVGDRFSAAGVTVYVAAIIRSDQVQDQNVAYTHLSFIQETTQRGGSGGIVTQFNVKISDPTQLDSTAAAIDAEFMHEQDPTSTHAEKAFVARAAKDILELVNFAAWLGWGAMAAVFALIANAIILAVQDRIRDHAVLQTLGYSSSLIARLIVSEGLLLGALGGIIGAAGAYAVVHFGRFTMTMEGQNIEIVADPMTIVLGLTLAMVLGVLAGLVPAWQASRREIVSCFRAV